jgi:hypothetical protein
VNISSAPQIIGDTFYARSKNIRFRIPRQPSPPNVRVDTGPSRRIQNMRTTFEFSFNPDDTNPVWSPYSGGTTINLNDGNLAALTGVFPGIELTDEDGMEAYRVWVRLAPVGAPAATSRRVPASQPVLLVIPANWFR